MNPDQYKFLFDILDSIAAIEMYLTGIKSLEEYKSDPKSIDAVERRLAIIGEALWKVDKIETLNSITNKTRIIGLRHILVHDYDLIDDETIWTICKKYLPILKQEVANVLPDNK